MSRKKMILFLVGLIAMAPLASYAGPAGPVRGGDRDRVAVLSVKDFNLQAYEGKVVLVGFWTSDCEQCEAYISWLTRMQEDYGPDGLVTVAVNQDRVTHAATDLLGRIHPRTQVVIDNTGKMGSRYELEDLPSSYLYDRNLDLQAKFVGFVPQETATAEKEIVDLLKKKYKD